MREKYFLGIDLGGTKIKTGLVNRQGQVLATMVQPTIANAGPEAISDQIIQNTLDLIKENQSKVKGIIGLGIGIPGMVNKETGLILKTPNLPLNNFNLLEPIRAKFPRWQIFLENDANAATLGEWLFGAGQGEDNVIYLTIGTGVGGGAILDKKLYGGQHNNALEIGHMIIDPNTTLPNCGCGQRGCLETLVSGPAITRQARLALRAGAVSVLQNEAAQFAPNFNNLKTVDVFEAALTGDDLAKQIVYRASSALGIGIANLIALFDPALIILGGGVMNQGDFILNQIRKSIESVSQAPAVKNHTIKIVLAKLGQNVGVIGAASLVIQNQRSRFWFL